MKLNHIGKTNRHGDFDILRLTVKLDINDVLSAQNIFICGKSQGQIVIFKIYAEFDETSLIKAYEKEKKAEIAKVVRISLLHFFPRRYAKCSTQ